MECRVSLLMAFHFFDRRVIVYVQVYHARTIHQKARVPG